MLQQTVAERIRALRVAAGLTQEQLAERVGIGPQYMSRLERARRVPSLDMIVELAAALNTTPSALLAEPDEDTRVEIVQGLRGRFADLSGEDKAFLESQISGLLTYVRKVRTGL